MLDLLIETGQALYGQQWQSPLARDLGVSDRTMRRWVACGQSVPAGITTDLLRLCSERRTALVALAKRLKSS